MPLQRITIEEKHLDRISADLKNAVFAVELPLQHVFSNHLVLQGAGYIETAVKHVLSEYARTHGDPRIRRFVERSVGHNNSLNCSKIQTVVDQFDTDWWSKVKEATSEEEREAVDSLKTLRDQIAHGKNNGTNFTTVADYCKKAKSFIRAFSRVVLGG